ncbi:MAG: PAS domain S-box protein, partial [Thermodesulfovibrionia bacterium]|nr:PAS domain S-box protein [Thermodesulfovibrionia bacterium]
RELFDRLNAISAKKISLVNIGSSEDELAMLDSLRARLISQLMLKLHRTSLDSQKLERLADLKIEHAQNILEQTIMIVLLGFAVYLALSLFFVNRSIASPLQKLVKSAEIIGSGNLDHRTNISGKDEISQLSGKFDQMTTNLKAVTASKDDLNKEIIERKEAEKELENIFNLSPDMICVCTPEGNFIKVNPSCERVLGYTTDEILKLGWAKLVHPDDMENTNKEVEKQLKGNSTINFVNRFRCKDGTYKILEWQATPSIDGIVYATTRDITMRKQAEEELQKAKDELEERVEERTAELESTVKLLQDEISERKKAEEKIKASLKEKDVLLQEIHHRVKNNMQVISSLINLQQTHIKDKDSIEMLAETQNRIKSMALIHEKLYKSKDMSKIDFIKYIEDFSQDLFGFYKVDNARIALKVDGRDTFFGIDTAIPCGLVINELVSNSLKYAFPDNRKGNIRIELHPINNKEFELAISDNGIGIPEDLDIKSTESLGLKLVDVLVRQIKGNIQCNRTNGTEFIIKFQQK